MRRAARKDGNHNEIVKAYKDLHCSVFETYQLGGGFGDAVVGIMAVTDIVEIKDPTQDPCKRKLTPAEKLFHESWKGSRVVIVETIEDVIRHVNDMRNRPC